MTESIARGILERLTEEVERELHAIGEEPRAVELLFSGGVDSSLLARLISRVRPVELRTLGLPGAVDLRRAERAARELGLPWKGVPVTLGELAPLWKAWDPDLVRAPEPRRSVLFALEVAFSRFPERRLFVGQGADELFGGYAHFEGLKPAEAVRRAVADLAALRTRDWPATILLGERHGVLLSAPYLGRRFVSAVERLAPEKRFPVGERKGLLRAMARAAQLPEELCAFPKKAMQYGSGIHRAVRLLSAAPGA